MSLKPGEMPTLLVAAAIYGGWLAATFWHAAIPGPLLAVIGAWLIAWHGSLQHETIHGHPCRSRLLNTVIGFPPLSLWLPYAIYRRSHLAHHLSPSVTDPALDPESRYIARASGIAAVAARAQASLVGRLLLGPPIAIVSFLVDELRRAGRAPRALARDWLPHLAAMALIFGWLEWRHFGLGRYLMLFVYPGMALTLLRSFAEHRADFCVAGRAATVERGGLLGLLYLNNNLHAAHHDRPDLAWYRLPAYHRDHQARLTGDGERAYRGYGEIVRRFALRRHHVLVHPAHEGGRA
ncbi:fatty acid desaturase [uncultured Sphingomonas sp.]|uniref:fatty acid desaturase n=1 Tax=uncultured Sphingomonas sp. TaxID=158754 RepID=UPI0035CAFEDC